MRQMAALCNNFIYMYPKKIVTKSASMSWAIKEEIAQSVCSSSLDPHHVSAQHLPEIQRGYINLQQTSVCFTNM